MEAFLRALLPRVLPAGRTFHVHTFQGKSDLLAKLQARLRGYARWLPNGWRIVVLVDRDDNDCQELKRNLESMAAKAQLGTRASVGPSRWRLVNRIVIEELEAWYSGDWQAVRSGYPRVSSTVPNKSSYHDPDAIRGHLFDGGKNGPTCLQSLKLDGIERQVVS